MEDVTALGLATVVENEVLVVHRVTVCVSDEGLELAVLPAWRAIRNDEARSLADLVDTLSNALDRKRPDAPSVVGLKRVETPIRGKPGKAYDKRTRAETAAMVAVVQQGVSYFGFRTNEIKARAHELRAAAEQADAYPEDSDLRDAVAAACVAIAEVR